MEKNTKIKIVERYKNFEKFVDIAKDYGITGERIRQIILKEMGNKKFKAIKRLKKIRTAKKYFNF